MTIGYASGVFDMFHIGHLNILRQASLGCDHLIAGVVTDEAVLQIKGRAPAIPQLERMQIVAAIRYVDEVVSDDSADKLQVWHAHPFDVIFKGDDWKGTAKGRRLESAMAGVGVEVAYFPYTVHTSSTQLRRFLDGA
ncbi:MAG TPA: adenylyltransferase/cytidyltransferase family protein [Candidatus Nanopelagicales bacterium]